jgi:hypothetical protein
MSHTVDLKELERKAWKSVHQDGCAMPAGLFAANIMVVFGMLAHFLDYPRLYVYGVLYAAAFPSWVLLIEFANVRLPVVSVPSAAVMVVIGCKGLTQFMRLHPIPTTEVAVDGNQ